MQFLIPFLVGIVIVAGAFTFIPIYQASSVHSSIQSTQEQIISDTFDASNVALADGDEIEITATKDYCIKDIQIEFANLDADDGIATTGIEINDINLLDGSAKMVANILDDVTAFDGDDSAIVSVMTGVRQGADSFGPLCAEANESIDFVLDDGGDGDGDLILGEIQKLEAWVRTDGGGTVTVTLGAAD